MIPFPLVLAFYFLVAFLLLLPWFRLLPNPFAIFMGYWDWCDEIIEARRVRAQERELARLDASLNAQAAARLKEPPLGDPRHL